SKPTSKVKIIGSRSHNNKATKNFITEIEKHNRVQTIVKGSSLKFCAIAEGSAHIYPRFAPTMEWDTAAGHAICKAVGLEPIDQSTNTPLKYNKPNLQNPHFILATPP
ncbi:3'(2'),5'-bisphosphate nucleotidase CysQ, partial [Aequorivita sp. F47161]